MNEFISGTPIILDTVPYIGFMLPIITNKEVMQSRIDSLLRYPTDALRVDLRNLKKKLKKFDKKEPTEKNIKKMSKDLIRCVCIDAHINNAPIRAYNSEEGAQIMELE